MITTIISAFAITKLFSKPIEIESRYRSLQCLSTALIKHGFVRTAAETAPTERRSELFAGSVRLADTFHSSRARILVDNRRSAIEKNYELKITKVCKRVLASDAALSLILARSIELIRKFTWFKEGFDFEVVPNRKEFSCILTPVMTFTRSDKSKVLLALSQSSIAILLVNDGRILFTSLGR